MGIPHRRICAFFLRRCDVVDGHLGSGTGGRRHGDGEHGVVLSRSNALEARTSANCGVVDDDADCLSGVHGGTATDGHDSVSLGGLEGLDAVLDVLDGGIGLDLGVEAPSDASGRRARRSPWR